MQEKEDKNINLIEETIKEYLPNPSYIYVFPTEVAAKRWQDRAMYLAPGRVIDKERFIAWDNFIEENIKKGSLDFECVTPIVREFFASYLISLNKKEKFLSSLIPPAYTDTSNSYASYIRTLLPALTLWAKTSLRAWQKETEDTFTFTENERLTSRALILALKTIIEDTTSIEYDLLNIYERYCLFLEQNNFYEPSYQGYTFDKSSNFFILFFPELIEDYLSYKEALAKSLQVQIVSTSLLPSREDKKRLFFYPNARLEVKNAALYIRALHDKEGVPFCDIAVNLPKIEEYCPYLTRELTLLDIPYTVKSSLLLGKTLAGSLFSTLKDCFDYNFNYNTLEALLLNNALPFKDKEEIRQLLNYGKQNNCAAPIKDKEGKLQDIWEESFKVRPLSENVKGYYRKLKRLITNIVTAKDFTSIRHSYNIFNNTFFIPYPKNAKDYDIGQNILSICVDKLNLFISYEARLSKYILLSPYSFYVDFLNRAQYTPQEKEAGVSIFQYKTAATALYTAQITLDASEESCNLTNSPLPFLNEEARKRLLGEDENLSLYLINLYNMNSKYTYWSASNKTFSSYSQGISYLTSLEADEEGNFFIKEDGIKEKESSIKEGNIKDDYYNKEETFLTSDKENKEEKAEKEPVVFPKTLTSIQKDGFNLWKQVSIKEENSSKEFNTTLQKMVKTRLYDGEVLHISQTHLKDFFLCPRAYLLKNIMKLQKDKEEVAIFDKFAIGNFYHKIFFFYFMHLKELGLPLAVEKDSSDNSVCTLPKEYVEYLTNAIDTAAKEEGNKAVLRYILGLTEERVLSVVLKSLTTFSKYFEGLYIDKVEEELKFPLPASYGFPSALLIGRPDVVLTDRRGGFFILDIKNTSSAAPKRKAFYLNEEEEEEEIAINIIKSKERNEKRKKSFLSYDLVPKIDFQLPLYTYLVEKSITKEGRGIEVSDAAFFIINPSKQEIEKPIRIIYGEALKDKIKMSKTSIKLRSDFQDTIDAALELSCLYAKKIRELDFNPLPNTPYSVCSSCQYRMSCRATFNISGNKEV